MSYYTRGSSKPKPYNPSDDEGEKGSDSSSNSGSNSSPPDTEPRNDDGLDDDMPASGQPQPSGQSSSGKFRPPWSSDPRTYPCMVCKRFYKCRATAWRHMKTKHPEVAEEYRIRDPKQRVSRGWRETVRKRYTDRYYAKHRDEILSRNNERRYRQKAMEILVTKYRERHPAPVEPRRPMPPPSEPEDNLYLLCHKFGMHDLYPATSRIPSTVQRKLMALMHPDKSHRRTQFEEATLTDAFQRLRNILDEANKSCWSRDEDMSIGQTYLRELDLYLERVKACKFIELLG